MSGFEFFTYMLGMLAGWILCAMFNEPTYPTERERAAVMRLQEKYNRPSMACPDGSTRCALGVHHD